MRTYEDANSAVTAWINPERRSIVDDGSRTRFAYLVMGVGFVLFMVFVSRVAAMAMLILSIAIFLRKKISVTDTKVFWSTLLIVAALTLGKLVVPFVEIGVVLSFLIAGLVFIWWGSP